jgi:ATP-dependent DNA helicase RecG
MVTVFGREDINVTDYVTDNVTDNVTDRSSLIISLINSNNKISTSEIARIMNVNKRTILREIELLKQNGLLKRVGSEKGGHWKT